MVARTGKGSWQDYQESKKAALLERRKERASRTPKQQLQVLDERLGKNQGAHKERRKLLASLQPSKSKKKNQQR